MPSVILDLASPLYLHWEVLERSSFSFSENGVTRMFQSSSGGAGSPSSFNLPSFNQETVRHILLGDHGALIEAMNRMAVLGYCDRIAWSEPLPTGRNGEFISVMTRKRTIP